MILLKPDHDRRIEIPGVARPVRRPVDIDRSLTNFSVLRTLRIYRFEKDSVIEGHAEEDEVFIVVLSGSIELTMSVDPLEKGSPVILAAPDGSGAVACAAYLPRHAAYTLIPQTDADIAYARASPASDRMPKVFSSKPRPDSSGVHLLLDEKTHAERLLLRLLCISSEANEARWKRR
jgi:5-deoxy-D-glucuronate isomerase